MITIIVAIKEIDMKKTIGMWTWGKREFTK
jgi:hypothetical protein